MVSEQDTEPEEASSRSDLSLHDIRVGPQEHFCGSHVGGCGNVISSSSYLLWQIEALSSEEHESILHLITKLDEIHAFFLVNDRVFLFRILPLVSGAVLRFFGECLRNGTSREQCICELL